MNARARQQGEGLRWRCHRSTNRLITARKVQAAASAPKHKGELRVLEFFSGIGTMHYALQRVTPSPLQLRVDAFDINTVANDVYAHNFHTRPHTYDLSKVTSRLLDDFRSDLWCLSPPCQPYTRTVNGQQRDALDPRAASLVRILEQLPLMAQPPASLILENVEGFLGGEVHGQLRQVLAACSYHLQEFLISPHQLGIPYLRARYFALARRQPLPTSTSPAPGPGGGITRHPPTLSLAGLQQALGSSRLPPTHLERLNQRMGPQHGQCQDPAGCRPAAVPPCPAPSLPHASPSAAAAACELPELEWPPCSFSGGCDLRPITQYCLPLGHFLEQGGRYNASSSGTWQQYAVPQDTLSKYWKCFDIVTEDSAHANCVTKNYSRNGIAAGSLLASPLFASSLCHVDDRGRVHFQQDPVQRCRQVAAGVGSGAPDEVLLQQVRYLSPREVANLHGFPAPAAEGEGEAPQGGFSLPPGVSSRQAYGLLGNSLSVDVFAWLLQYLLYQQAPPHGVGAALQPSPAAQRPG